MEKPLFSALVMEKLERNLNKLHSVGALDDEFFLSVN